MAAALHDDAVDGRQAEAGALPRLLGGEERLEDLRAGRGVHTAPRVADGELDVWPDLRLGVLGGVCRVDHDVGGFDRHPTAVRHRVAGVHDQVHQHLLELPRVGLDRRARGAGLGQQIDVLADQPPQHGADAANHGVEVEDLRLEDLLAPEGEELARQVLGAAGRPLDELHVATEARFVADLLPQQDGAPGDHRQEVVEVVGHAAGQLADRLHLLRLREPLLRQRDLLVRAAELLVQPGVLHRGRGLRRERRHDRHVFVGEPAFLLRVDGQHPGRSPADLDRHSEERLVAEAANVLAMRGQQPRVVGEIGHDERLSGLRDQTAEALADLQAGRRHQGLGVAERPGDHQLVALDDPEADRARPEQVAARLGDPVEHRLERLEARELVHGFEERLQAPLAASQAFQELEILDAQRRLAGDGLHQSELLVGERVGVLRPREGEHRPHLVLDPHREDQDGGMSERPRPRIVLQARIALARWGTERRIEVPQLVEERMVQGDGARSDQLLQIPGHAIAGQRDNAVLQRVEVQEAPAVGADRLCQESGDPPKGFPGLGGRSSGLAHRQ